MYAPRVLFSANLPYRSFSLGLYPPLQNKCPVIIESEGKVWSVSMHKVNRIMRFRGGERKGERLGKEGRGKEERGGEWNGEEFAPSNSENLA